MVAVGSLGALLARFLIVLLCGWLMTMPAHAAPTAVEVHTQASPQLLASVSQVFEDETGEQSLQALIERDHVWRPYQSDTFNLGFAGSVWWARVRLLHRGTEPQTFLLDIGTPLQDEVEFFVLRADGTLLQRVLTGDRHAYATRPVHARVPTIELTLRPHEVQDVYVRMASHDGLQEAVSLRLWEPQAHREFLQKEQIAFGVYFGALATVMLYNLFLFLSTKQTPFGWYSAYVAAFLVWGLAFRGFAFQYWWPDSPTFNNQMLPIAAAISYLLFGVFMMTYLNTREHAPRWMHRVIVWATAGNLLAVSPALFGFYALSFAFSIPFGVTLIVFALAIGMWMAWHGSRPARYFVTAFSLLAIGVVLYYLRVLGVVPSNMVTENFLQIGSALEVLLLAFGLADQMNTLRAAKLKAERKALAAQEALNTELESLVKRRTRALEAANQRLEEMAITDELTGAFNRRHFNAAFQAEVGRHMRHRSPLVFCMLDIDQFKLYNDRYGHLAGDEVLKRVSRVVTSHLQRAGDQFFRLGGEEFGILLTVDDPPEKIEPFIERIRLDIMSLAMPHEPSAHGVITASFGLVWAGPQSTIQRPEDVYAAADRLLYEAKAQGRNSVRAQAL